MKKILGLLTCLFLMNIAIGQSENGTAIFTSTQKVDNEKGVYEFQFKEDLASQEKIDETTAFYTDYFTVDTKTANGLHTMTVTLNEVSYDNKKLMHRLLVTLNLKKVSFQNKTYDTRAFVEDIILN